MSQAHHVLRLIADGCEQSAKVAAACAMECHPDGAHSPEFFEGWRAAMLSVAEHCRLTADGQRTLERPRLEVVR